MTEAMGLRETQIALRAAVDGYDAAFHIDSSREEDQEAATRLRDAAEAAVIALASSWGEADTCKVGDRDPTPNLLAEHDQCQAVDADDQLHLGCTRYFDHAGRQHVAGNGERVVHVWPSRPGDGAARLASEVAGG